MIIDRSKYNAYENENRCEKLYRHLEECKELPKSAELNMRNVQLAADLQRKHRDLLKQVLPAPSLYTAQASIQRSYLGVQADLRLRQFASCAQRKGFSILVEETATVSRLCKSSFISVDSRRSPGRLTSPAPGTKQAGHRSASAHC